MTQNRCPFYIQRFPFAVLSVLLVCPGSAGHDFTEGFAADPFANGGNFREPTFCHWDSTNHNLSPSRGFLANHNYLYHSRGTILAIDDALALSSIESRRAQTGAYGFAMAVGFLNISNAPARPFCARWARRHEKKNECAEFDYFPPSQISVLR